jgi:hypothetical protein
VLVGVDEAAEPHEAVRALSVPFAERRDLLLIACTAIRYAVPQ